VDHDARNRCSEPAREVCVRIGDIAAAADVAEAAAMPPLPDLTSPRFVGE